jgi:hypothetical protein
MKLTIADSDENVGHASHYIDDLCLHDTYKVCLHTGHIPPDRR